MINKAKKVLITGVAGFIGRYVARHFFQKGWSVIGIDSSCCENAPVDNLANYYRIRLPSKELDNVLKDWQPEVFVHCAGGAAVSLSTQEPYNDFQSNTVLTFAIINSLRLYTPECRFIFLSSAAVYGNPKFFPISEDHLADPISPYGFHKLQSELICEEFTKVYGLPTACLRIFSAYGSGLRRQVIWDICQKIIVHQQLNLKGTGKESRDFVHGFDIAQSISIIAEQAPMQAEVYNVASGGEVTISELALKIIDILQAECSPLFDGIIPPGTPLNWKADISKLAGLGFKNSVDLEQGLHNFVYWCKAELMRV